MQHKNARIALWDRKGPEVGWKLRRAVDKRQELLKAVNIILLNRNNDVFMIKARSSLWPHIWGGSCAGLVRHGESASDAAHRTLLRELRLDVPVLLVGERYRRFGGVRRLLAVFLGRTAEEPRVSRRDIAEVQWVSLADARRMAKKGTCTPAFAAALSEARSYLNAAVRRHRTA